MSKPTMATIKAFVRKNRQHLLIRCSSSFDGMVDCVTQNTKAEFRPAQDCPLKAENHTLGIRGAWFVGRSRDYITPISENGVSGFHIYNCCGSFDLAVRVQHGN